MAFNPPGNVLTTIIVTALASVGLLLSTSTIKVSTFNSTITEYVNPSTGTDNSNCQTQASPCQTINYAIQQGTNAIQPGVVKIMLADGTYPENVVGFDLMGASSTPSTAVTSIPYGNSRVEIIGNTTNPDNVIIQGSSGKLGVFSMENLDTTYVLNGMRLVGTGGASESAVYAAGKGAQVIVNNINTSSTGRIITLGFGAVAYYDNGTAGAKHNFSGFGMVIGRDSTMYLNKGISATSTVTGANLMFSVSDFGQLITGTTNQTYNFYSPDCTGGGGFIQPSGLGAKVKAFSNGDVVNFNCGAGGVSAFRPISGADVQIIGSPTINVSSTASFAMADIDAASRLYSIGTPTWNVVGSTPRGIRLYQGAMSLEPTNYGGATVTYAEFDTDYNYGFDDRYLRQENIECDGTVTPALTTGAQTINKPCGSVNIAGGQTSIVVTSTLVTTNSIIQAIPATNDLTCTALKAVPSSGFFTMYCNATATAETSLRFMVFNPN